LGSCIKENIGGVGPSGSIIREFAAQFPFNIARICESVTDGHKEINMHYR
jgi:hypothetical protein